MKWEVGKYYRTEKGRKARVYANDGGGLRRLHGAVLYPDGWLPRAWQENGRTYVHKSGVDDIVGEWKESESSKYRHYSHEELKTFIGKVVICKATGLPELIVGMADNLTIRLGVRETPVTAFDLLVMYEWDSNLPCGMLVKEAVGDGITDDTEAMQGIPKAMAHAPPLGRKPKRSVKNDYDPSNVDGVIPSFEKPDQPKHRPFSEDELSFLIDRVIRRSDCSGWLGKVGWINDCRVLCGQEWNSPEDLFTHWEIEQPDGTWGPCGVLTSTGSCCGVIVGARAPFTDSWGIMGRPVDSWESMGRGRPSETVE